MPGFILRSEQGFYLPDVGHSFELTDAVEEAAASTLRSEGWAFTDAGGWVDHVMMQCPDVGHSLELTDAVEEATASTLRSEGWAFTDAGGWVDHVMMQCEMAAQLRPAPAAVPYPAR